MNRKDIKCKMKKDMKCLDAKRDKNKKYKRIYELSAIYMLIAHFGWIFEKLGRFIVYNSLSDRGFLSLPFCPIYGTAVLGSYLVLGTPQKMRIFTRPLRLGTINGVALYFLISFILASVIELCIGACFGEVIGFHLWNYSERAFNIFGYVCLSYSLLWGALLTIFMLLLWRRVDLMIGKLSESVLYGFCNTVYILVFADLLFNVIYLSLRGTHFEFL